VGLSSFLLLISISNYGRAVQLKYAGFSTLIRSIINKRRERIKQYFHYIKMGEWITVLDVDLKTLQLKRNHTFLMLYNKIEANGQFNHKKLSHKKPVVKSI